jgi:quinol-cytochrome oxidoreductase complex cytochrome b subunit
VRRFRYAFVVLAALTLVSAAASILFTVTYYQREQAAQRAASAAFERKLCTSLNALAALSPPPGSPGDNPSRAYLLQQHQVLAELGPDVGCGSTRRKS